MKTTPILIWLLLLNWHSGFAQDDATNLIDQASKLAIEQNRNIFIVFNNDQCPWCIRFQDNLKDSECGELFDKNYIMCKIQVFNKLSNPRVGEDTAGAMELLKKYKGEKAGVPFWVILDQRGNLLVDSFGADGENIGCPAEEDMSEFIYILKSTSKLSDDELDIISKHFLTGKDL